jgi:muconolactone delta-isomerase
MEYLAIFRRRVEKFSDAEFDAVLTAEAARARELYAQGAFRTLYTRGDVPGAVIVIEADDASAAERMVASLPLARKAMMDVELIPLRPYRGFLGG